MPRLASGDTCDPANEGHFKTGQRTTTVFDAHTHSFSEARLRLMGRGHSGQKALNPRGLGTESPTSINRQTAASFDGVDGSG